MIYVIFPRCGKQGFQSPPDKNFTVDGQVAGNWGYEVSPRVPALTVKPGIDTPPSADYPTTTSCTLGMPYRTTSQLRPSHSSETSWWEMLDIVRNSGELSALACL